MATRDEASMEMLVFIDLTDKTANGQLRLQGASALERS